MFKIVGSLEKGMEAIFKNMDFLIKHWAPYSRKFPAPFHLVSMDFVRKKNHWTRHRFNTCNFSLVLRGRGEFRRLGKTWKVESPCVITQWPGEYVEYGPLSLEEGWDELYLIYQKSDFGRLRKNGLIDVDLPVWPITDPENLAGPLSEIGVLARSRDPESVVDRMDRVAERLILETRMHQRSLEPSGTRMQAVLVEVERRLSESVDWRELAMRHGMSEPTFRRRWLDIFDLPPARYLQELRMHKACRLLVESRMPIRELAAQVGFRDELYFSRRFHLEHGVSPRDYRKTYRLNRGAIP